MGIVESSRASLLRTLAQQVTLESTDCAVVEGAKAPESQHQNPAWVRRCVASFIQKGGMAKKPTAGTDREDVSKAFAICRAQYNKMSEKKQITVDASSQVGKKAKKRMDQYEKILAKVRKKPG